MTLPYNTYFEQPDKLQFIDLQIRLTTFPVEAIIFSRFPIERRTGKDGKPQRLRFMHRY